MKAALKSSKERTRFYRFAIVGAIGAVLDFSVFNLLIKYAGYKPVIANLFSFSVAVLSNYFLNRYWTYPDSRSKAVIRQLFEFFVVNAIGIGIRTGIFVLVESPMESVYGWLHLPLPISASFFGHNAALAVAIGIVLFWNFFVNRYWTYADIE